MSAVRHLLNRLRDRGRMLAGEPFFDCRMSAAQLELLDQFGIDPGLGCVRPSAVFFLRELIAALTRR